MPNCIIEKYPAIFDPDADLDYGRNWGDAEDGTIGWLQPNESIVGSVWEITADLEATPTLVVSSQSSGIDTTGKITFIFLKGGTEGVTYMLSNIITTNDSGSGASRKEKRSGLIYCCRK